MVINQQPCGKVLYEAMQNSIIKRVKSIFIASSTAVVINAFIIQTVQRMPPVDINCDESPSIQLHVVRCLFDTTLALSMVIGNFLRHIFDIHYCTHLILIQNLLF